MRVSLVKILYLRPATYEVFLGGFSILKKFCDNPFRIAWKATSCERKNFFAIYGSFYEIDVFPLGVQVHLNKLECRGKVHLFQ